MSFKYSGFYKITKDSDQSQPKYRDVFIQDGIFNEVWYNNDGKEVAQYKARNFDKENTCFFSCHSGSTSTFIETKNKKISKHVGYGKKFGKPEMKYDAKHTMENKHGFIVYKNSYIFENGDTSKAKYYKISDKSPF